VSRETTGDAVHGVATAAVAAILVAITSAVTRLRDATAVALQRSGTSPLRVER
jgi:hypothetical protein